MEQLQRVADVKVVATADGGAPYSLEKQRFCFVFFVVVFVLLFFCKVQVRNGGLTRFIYV